MSGRSPCLIIGWARLREISLAAFLWLAAGAAPANGAAVLADLSSHIIAIGGGFTGDSVVLFGSTDGPGDIIAVVRGPERNMTVWRKGKVAGIWVNAESLTFNNLPAFYAVVASRPVEQLIQPSVAALYKIGTPYLKYETAPPASPERARMFSDALIKEQRQAGLFVADIGKVTFLGERLFRATLSFPENVPTGTYLVQVFLIRDGDVVSGQTTPLVVSKVGLDAEISDFAIRQSAAYGAIYAALSQDSKVANSFLNITDGTAFQTAIRQMLPDHAGGTFAAVSAGSRAIGRMLTDGGAPYVDKGKWGYWLEEVAYGGSKSFLNTASYDINGWGTSGGAEYKTKLGNFGLSLAYLHGNDNDNGTDNTVSSDQYEVAAYWRGDWSGLRPFARVSAARVNFASERSFTGNDGTSTAVALSNSSKWNGKMLSATGGASYEGAVGHLTFRPILSVDYYRLDEDAHTETGGGKAFDLSIAKRTSDEFAANATMAVGLTFGSTEDGWFHTEIEAGRRQILGGELGSTTASFAGGQAFTLIPDQRTDGWVGRFRASGGSPGFRIGGEVGAEEQQSRAALSLRATLQIGL